MSDDVLVKVEGVSKKFCRSLKRSLWYGVQDVASEMLGREGHHDELRKNEFWAVNDVSFELKRGECLGLIGPNGAGKSTLLKMLNGLVKPDKGRITMRGRVGALIELGAGFNPILTGRENIYVNGSVLGFTKKEIDQKFDAIVDFAEIEEFIDTPVQNYSSGMKVRLGFAVAAQMEPDVLLIDEVLAVGDVGFRMKCFSYLRQLLDTSTSIIFVTHEISHLSRITRRLLVLSGSKQVFDGSLNQGIAHYDRVVALANSRSEETRIGPAHFAEIVMRDSCGKPSTEFCTRDSILIDMTIGGTIPVTGLRVIAQVESPAAGILGSFSTPWSSFHFDHKPPETSVRLCMPEIPLLVGGYFLNLHLYGPKIEDYMDRKAPGIFFRIKGPDVNAFGFGMNNIFAFQHNWMKVD